MFLVLHVVFWTVLKFMLAALAFLYAGLVLMAYRTEGPRFQLRADWQGPFRSAPQLLVWLGVRALAAIVRIGTGTWDMLSEASADLGEWYVRRRGPEAEAIFRSRFL
ncbi:MAG: hypothetical protein ABSA70_14735 [Terriglobia bacterium]